MVRAFTPRYRQVVALAAILLAAAEVWVDWATWIQLNVSIVFVLPLVVAARSRSRPLLWTLAAILAVTTLIVYARQTSVPGFSFRDPYLVNRMLSISSMFIAAALLHILIGALDELDRRGKDARDESGRKTRILASISHDLRTPLTAINLIADRIQSTAGRPELAEEHRELASDLKTSSSSLGALVTNAFDLAQIDAGNTVLQESDFALDAFLRDECRVLGPAAAAKGLALRVAPSSGVLWLRTDRVKLSRVLRNLVGNAVKFTHEGGVMLGAALGEDGSARITVADTGIGIGREDLERVFEEFTRLHPTEPAYSGWGLGLAISRRLAALMGGSVSAAPGPERGSIFTVTLPAFRIVRAPVQDDEFT
jgi:signal transduction histidine kinase